MDRLRHFLSELRRRKVYRVAVVYSVVGFAVWQASDFALEASGIADPDSAATLVFWLTILGLPIALVLAWAYELKPEEPAPTATTAEAPSAVTGVRTESAPTPPSDPSIAVLPFDNMSAEPESEYFADGISEELTLALGRRPSLRVAARTSAFAFKGEKSDVRDIGSRLGVSYVVEGSVRRAGTRLRVTAQLIDTRDGYHVWSDRFDRELDDVFAIQDDIVGAVVDSLLARLGEAGPASAPASVPRTSDLDAYDLYLRGRHALRHFDPASVSTAVGHFEEAIAVDPAFAPTHAALAEALTLQAIGFFQGSGAAILQRARAAAEHAIRLDASLPDAHVALGLSHLYHDWAYQDAKRQLDAAIDLNPSYADAHRWLEFYWTYVETDYDEAMAALARAQAIDPLDGRVPMRRLTVEYLLGDPEKAVTGYRAAVEDSATPIALIGLMDSLTRAGRHREAAELALEAGVETDAPDVWLGVTGVVLALGGRDAETRDRLAILESRAQSGGYALPFWRGLLHASLGELDRAFDFMARAIEDRDGGLLYLALIPRIPGLQEDPRFAGLLRQIGLGHLVHRLPSGR